MSMQERSNIILNQIITTVYIKLQFTIRVDIYFLIAHHLLQPKIEMHSKSPPA